MIIISDCVKNTVDEGCIKVASSLARRLKARGATLIAINTECSYADYSISANKTYTNSDIYDCINNHEGNILYIPFASNTLGTAIRVWNLTKKSKRKICVLFSLRWKMCFLTKYFLMKSKCTVLTISQDSYSYFKDELKTLKVINVKTGVDTKKFLPVSVEKKKELRRKYGIPEDKQVLLHVGHLKHGRNVDCFLEVDDNIFSVLVFSSVTEKDEDLRNHLMAKNNILIIESYLEHIEEIYQLADVYVFPIVEESNSIDVPLSVLEAAGCNLNIIATKYKEVSFFNKVDGLLVSELNDFDVNDQLKKLNQVNNCNTRELAIAYDWENSLETIEKTIACKQ